MDRPRSKRNYHHYDQDSDSQTPPRTKPRYDAGNHRRPNHHRRNSDRRHPPPPPPPPPPPSSSKLSDISTQDIPFTTFFRILCSDAKICALIRNSGSFIKNIRQETGSWISIHDVVPGDDERIIETADNRRREQDGRPPLYSPAQNALLLIHERILDLDFEEGGLDEERVTTRLVVPRLHVGCLLGKGGKIIEHMRNETRTHIRILPRDQNTPRCVSMSEEVVQVDWFGSYVGSW